MKQIVVDQNNKRVGEVELNDAVFTGKPNLPLIYESVKMILTNQRRGTAATKNTALVSGTTAKMYRQKGTGRARHSSYKANIFVGGGSAFGPQPRDYRYDIPKRARQQALSVMLALKRSEERLVVVDRFALTAIKTKQMVAILETLGVKQGVIVVDAADEKLAKSVRNIPGMKLVTPLALNALDLLNHEYLICTQGALATLEARLTR